MKTIVITGSTRGIGRGLADSFLARGCAVAVSGRATESVERVVSDLAGSHDAGRVWGQACDVTDMEQVQALWDGAKAHYGTIDVWINNAGVPNPRIPFSDYSSEQIDAVVGTNLLGTIYGARVAVRGMLEQGGGSLYNMEGLGSDGRTIKGTMIYATTKSAVRYLTRALVEETRGTPVRVGALSPGMVVTDFLTAGQEGGSEEWERTKRVLNILADRVETVTPWLAERVLADDKHGAHIAWLTRGKVMWRFLTASLRKRDLFA
ncbi:MAG: SDR family oxidoreductase [Anaerolineae bacterium]|nr:SDR family oxidoreductase [Anaerolineae bacterium]